MTRARITQEYFAWMCHLVCEKNTVRGQSWKKLLSCLHEHEFVYILDMDSNRADDGIDLRYRFAYEMDLNPEMIVDTIDTKPCSILEMMVALTLRCEEQIMDEPAEGDRTGQWFWTMIQSLGLITLDDRHFDAVAADQILVAFLRREYQANGRGGLFMIKQPRRDVRTVEIWYQMMWYLDDYLDQ